MGRELEILRNGMSKDSISILDLVERDALPEPWAEGYIPWSEPGFSVRMLKEHLSQAHDMASRRFEIIDDQVEWIESKLLKGKRSSILDLGCGPGFYSSRLARLGHECVGIDYSPASIEYATEQAAGGNLSCKYLHEDIRKADFCGGFDLAMLLFGELNVFQPTDAKAILKKVNNALNENGLLLLEPHSFDVIKSISDSRSSWFSAMTGLFSDEPYLCLEEGFWDEDSCTATKRFFIIDAETGNVSRYAATYQAYTEQQFRGLLDDCGFGDIEFYPMLGEAKEKEPSDPIAIVAKKCRDETI